MVSQNICLACRGTWGKAHLVGVKWDDIDYCEDDLHCANEVGYELELSVCREGRVGSGSVTH